jgi:hypothetical protein
MKKSIGFMLFSLPGLSQLAFAYQYPLQFKPNAGYRGFIVAGYKFEGNNVVGNCSYYTVSGGGSGKGGGGRAPAKIYAQTCAWDSHGNLLSLTPGAPAIPAPMYTKGSLVVYAVNDNGDYTGTDNKLPERGFVSSAGAHYTWLTPNHNAVLQQFVYTLTAALKSDGDVAVNIFSVAVSALNGVATLKRTDCEEEINVGDKCSVTLTYDPTKLTGNNGLATDTLRIDLNSDAGEAHDFIQNFTILLPGKDNDN